MRRLTILVVLVFLSSLSIAQSHEKLRIAVSKMDSIPYSWYDECKNEIMGSSHHILNKVFLDLGFELEAIPQVIKGPSSIKEIVQEANNGSLDFIYGVGGGRRLTQIGLEANNIPVVIFERGIVYSLDQGKVDTLKDLEGRKGIFIGTTKNSMPLALENALKENALSLEVFTSLEEAFLLLIDKKIDYIIDNRFSLKLAAINSDVEQNFGFTKIEELETKVFIAAPLGSKHISLFSKIDERIEFYRSAGLEELITSRFLNLWSSRDSCLP